MTKDSKPQLKKDRVHQMIASAPSSVAEIAATLSISKQAAYSLIGDLKRAGVKFTATLKDGAMHYSIASQPEAKAARKRAFGKKEAAAPSPE